MPRKVRRPLLVSLIFFVYLFISLAEIGLMFLITAGAFDLPPQTAAAIESMDMADRIAGYVIAALVVVGVFLLYRMKRRAVPVLLLALALDAAGKIAAWFRHGLDKAMDPSGLSASFAGTALFALVCLYAWRLGKKGRLA